MTERKGQPVASPELLVDGPRRANCTIVLAHGAGAAMDTEFMTALAEGLAERGSRVVRFEFSYMHQRRKTGKRRPPDREPVLRETWHRVIESLKTDKLVIGGKSMGGRIASLIADEVGARGLVCLGYPFHPTGKPEQLRVEQLQTIMTPTLIVQGERDPLGNAEEVANYPLSRNVQIHWLTDGDHSFKPRKASGKSLDENMTEAITVVADFIESLK